jgi:hypothetical protein
MFEDLSPDRCNGRLAGEALLDVLTGVSLLPASVLDVRRADVVAR